MKINLSPQLEQRLTDLARKTGRPETELVAAILEAALLPIPTSPGNEPTVSFHETTTDLESLVRAQGVKPVARFEDLLADFWPTDESVEEFLAVRQEWSHEGRGLAPTE